MLGDRLQYKWLQCSNNFMNVVGTYSWSDCRTILAGLPDRPYSHPPRHHPNQPAQPRQNESSRECTVLCTLLLLLLPSLSSTPLRRRNSSEENEPDSSRVEEGRLRYWGFRTGSMFLVQGEKVGMEVPWDLKGISSCYLPLQCVHCDNSLFDVVRGLQSHHRGLGFVPSERVLGWLLKTE